MHILYPLNVIGRKIFLFSSDENIRTCLLYLVSEIPLTSEKHLNFKSLFSDINV